MTDVSPATTGLLLVISGPSGVGKTTLAHEVERRLRGSFSVSATTRPKTAGDIDGQDYHFVDETTFERMIHEGAFLEYARVFGRHCYGTPREPVEKMLAAGKLVVLDIDVQGAMQIRKSMAASFQIFLLPPSEEELLRRLRRRARDDEEAIAQRFAESKREIILARQSEAYDHFVRNDDLEAAIEEVCELVRQRGYGR